MKRLYHTLAYKYYTWKIKREYKRIFASTPAFGHLYVSPAGNFYYMPEPFKVWLVTGCAWSVKDNSPALTGIPQLYKD